MLSKHHTPIRAPPDRRNKKQRPRTRDDEAEGEDPERHPRHDERRCRGQGVLDVGRDGGGGAGAGGVGEVAVDEVGGVGGGEVRGHHGRGHGGGGGELDGGDDEGLEVEAVGVGLAMLGSLMLGMGLTWSVCSR